MNKKANGLRSFIIFYYWILTKVHMSFLVHIRLISANYSHYHPIRGSKSRQKVVENRWINIGFTYSLNSANLSPLSKVTLLWGTYIVRIWPWQHWYSRRKVQLFFFFQVFSYLQSTTIAHKTSQTSFIFFFRYVRHDEATTIKCCCLKKYDMI